MATEALALKHRTISMQRDDKIFIVFNQFQTKICNSMTMLYFGAED